MTKENLELKPCPFCSREIFNHFGEKAIIHKNGCPMLNGTTEHIKLLSKYEIENWNTRSNSKPPTQINEEGEG